MINVFKTVKRLYLEEVDFSQNNINEIASLPNLEELVIKYNAFPIMLDYNPLNKLQKLTSLEFESRDAQEKFEEVPEFIYSLTNLKKLSYHNLLILNILI